MERYEHVCPVESARGLDSGIRKIAQNPQKILKGRIREGMTVLDMGCGTGYFTTEIARQVGSSGKVIAADLQQGMLDILKSKVRGTDIEGRIVLHKCEADRIGAGEKVDLAVAFFMVHEVPDKKKLLQELKSMLKPGGSIYIVEYRMHPPVKVFNEMVDIANSVGLVEKERSGSLISRAIVFQ